MVVKVIGIPIRYNKKSHRKGEAFEISEEHYKGIANLVETIEEENKTIDKMTIDELKTYAEEKQIDLGGATKKAEILAIIKAIEVN